MCFCLVCHPPPPPLPPVRPLSDRYRPHHDPLHYQQQHVTSDTVRTELSCVRGCGVDSGDAVDSVDFWSVPYSTQGLMKPRDARCELDRLERCDQLQMKASSANRFRRVPNRTVMCSLRQHPGMPAFDATGFVCGHRGTSTEKQGALTFSHARQNAQLLKAFESIRELLITVHRETGDPSGEAEEAFCQGCCARSFCGQGKLCIVVWSVLHHAVPCCVCQACPRTLDHIKFLAG